MATVLAVRSEVTGKRPIKLTPKMQGAGGLGTRLSGGVKKRKAVGGRLITKARKDGASEHVDDNDDVDDVAGNTGIDNASAAAADPSSGAGDAAPLGVQVHADDFSDEEHDEEEERTKLQTEKQVLTVTLISCAAGDGRQDTLNNITERDGASLPSQSPAGSPLEGVAAASDQAANGRLAELERTTQQQSQLISSLLLQLNNGSCSLERGAVGHASGSPSTNGTPRSAPTSQQAHVATPEREMLQRLTSNRASPAVPRKRKYPTMKNNGNVCDVVLHTSLSGIPLRDQILMRQLPSYGKAWNSTCSSRMLICHVSKFPNLPILFRIPMYQKKMELAVVVAFFRQPDDVTSVYPSESVVMRCLIGVWGESKAAALVAVMTYCVARAGASTRKQSDWRARISMNGRRNFADAYGLVCEANPRLKFDYSELICDEERTPTQVYNLESKGGIPLVKPLEKGGLLIWHFAEGTMRPFGTALFDIIVRNAFQKGAGGSATVVKAYHIAYLLYLSPFEFSLGESGGSLQLAVMSGTIKWPHPPLSASSFPSPNLPSFLLLPIFPPPPPLPLLPALFPRPFLPIPSRLFSSPFPNPRYGQSPFEFSLGESGGSLQLAVEYSVVHHKARGKRIPTDADVNAADIACYHRKVKAAIRKTLEESPDDQLPAWSEQYQGWVFGPTETVVISGSGFPDLVPDGADPDAAEKKAVALLFEYAQVEPEKGKKKKTGSNNSDATMERDLLDDVGLGAGLAGALRPAAGAASTSGSAAIRAAVRQRLVAVTQRVAGLNENVSALSGMVTDLHGALSNALDDALNSALNGAVNDALNGGLNDGGVRGGVVGNLANLLPQPAGMLRAVLTSCNGLLSLQAGAADIQILKIGSDYMVTYYLFVGGVTKAPDSQAIFKGNACGTAVASAALALLGTWVPMSPVSWSLANVVRASAADVADVLALIQGITNDDLFLGFSGADVALSGRTMGGRV
ncbi:unnamed protein product [Closterium sp. NIES-65]|nr:unnamed protein product [Closterium sp. NIES-65]